ncbi:hydrogenase [Bifidobacterium pseudolongum subsp. globosum]|uniref:Hydrogenase n=1 Tax=Bifidobacterium pseudolongum subsp. globosum TaxID=1690 RepID=A0A4Q5A0C9_9BIFI|nr:DUF3737 family protein [Bifidobacterium pseudolongum]RYQ10406.1 hydrogenase [Bifidobacterium pseudolongum subsp. globosum]
MGTNTITQQLLTGERALFQAQDLAIRDCVFENGESPLKESRGITFENCTIESLQGLCYVDGLTMRDCRLINTTRAFEYCTDIDAQSTTRIDGIVNPTSVIIRAPQFGEIVQNDPAIDRSQITIVETE